MSDRDQTPPDVTRAEELTEVDLEVAKMDIDVLGACIVAAALYADVGRPVAAGEHTPEPLVRRLKLHLPDDHHPWPRLEMRHPTKPGRSIWCDFRAANESEEPF